VLHLYRWSVEIYHPSELQDEGEPRGGKTSQLHHSHQQNRQERVQRKAIHQDTIKAGQLVASSISKVKETKRQGRIAHHHADATVPHIVALLGFSFHAAKIGFFRLSSKLFPTFFYFDDIIRNKICTFAASTGKSP